MLKNVFTACIVTAVAAGSLAAGASLLRQEMPQPTPEHAQILEGVGTWEGTMTNFMTEDGKPATTACKEVVEPIGGFWTQSRFTCTFEGMDYLGTGCSGYDPAAKKYIGTWIDNMSSYLALMKGDYDARTKTLVMRWDGPDMMGNIVPHRFEATFTDPDSYTSTFYANDTKSMLIEMKRKASASVRPAGAK
jgi:hypothetical protein